NLKDKFQRPNLRPNSEQGREGKTRKSKSQIKLLSKVRKTSLTDQLSNQIRSSSKARKASLKKENVKIKSLGEIRKIGLKQRRSKLALSKSKEQLEPMARHKKHDRVDRCPKLLECKY
ncbi:hypothetical protein Taro_020095, partial [Colocasia esculenta]|nr:hypothetical protein [Colocasia esculenta]